MNDVRLYNIIHSDLGYDGQNLDGKMPINQNLETHQASFPPDTLP